MQREDRATGVTPGGDAADAGLLHDGSFIGGAWTGARQGTAAFAVHDPATGEIVHRLAPAGAAEARAAVEAAHAAFGAWSRSLPQERSRLLRRWYELVCAHREALARLMTLEQGKPIGEARGEIDYGASFIEFFSEEARRTDVMGVTSHLEHAEVEVWREPVGVAALVTPWNFPNAMITRKAAAALAVGCTVVVHPSKETPLSALALAALAERAGFAPGVFNVVVGDPAPIVGAWMAEPRVRALSFTGSTAIGRLLYGQAAATVKRISLELGGHAPFIVFADAGLERAVEEGIKAKFATSGQDCLAANRFFVERPMYARFCEAFAARTRALRVGSGLEDPDIGPLVNAAALAKQRAQIDDALARGARLLCGGGVREDLGPLFFEPTVLADLPPEALILSEETFGPVAALLPFDTEEEVVARANATEFGLIAYLHTRDPARIYRLTRALEFGMVGVNRTKVTGAPIPFGGVKQSGLGREGSRQGVEAFSDIKYVCRDWS